MGLKKLIVDAITGEEQIVPFDEADLADLAVRQAAAKLMLDAEAATEQARLDAVAAVADMPSADDIRNAKNFAELQNMLLRMQGGLAAMAKQNGLAD